MLDHAIWWHVYPLGACGAPIRVEHGEQQPRLRRLDGWLDHVVELGCNGLLLGPIFASATHGYDTLDHFRIDPRLGGDEDFDHLVAEASRRGLHVILDGVFNHVAREHPIVAERPALVRWDGDQPKGWEGHGELVELHHENPEVQDLVVEVMLHWLRRGIAGWRLDVAYAVPGWFWKAVIERVREEFPGAVFLGEVIHGDYAGMVVESGWDTLTQYELWKAIWSSLTDVNGWELAHALERHAEFSRAFVPNTFLGNHDVTRFATRVPAAANLAPYLLVTLPGAPSVYYGDEFGYVGEKADALGGDDDVRPLLPDGPGDMAFGGDVLRHYQAAIALRRRQPWLVRAQVEVLEKQNELLRYRAFDDAHSIEVALDLATPAIHVTGEGEQIDVGPRA